MNNKHLIVLSQMRKAAPSSGGRFQVDSGNRLVERTTREERLWELAWGAILPIKRQEAASRPHSEQSERVGARKDGWTPTLQWEAGKSAATCKWFDGSRGNHEKEKKN